MTRRRGNGEGCIHRETSGRYRVSISVWQDGRRRRKTRTAWKHADAVAILAALKADAGAPGAGLVAVSRKLTVAEHCTEWLNKIVITKKKRAENTVDSYRRVIDNLITPPIGEHNPPQIGPVALAELMPDQVEDWLSDLAQAGRGSRTIENAFKVLRSAIKWACITHRVTDDPMLGISKPEHEQEEMFPFTLDEARTIISHTEGSRHHAQIVLGLTAGIRSGELLGLPWENVDLRAARIHIKQQAIEIKGSRTLAKPKSKSSIRQVDITADAVDALKDHRAIMLREGHAANPIVFPAPCGAIESRANFRQRVWLPILKKIGLKARGFHHTRHTYATLSLAAGVNIAVVSKQLGHSKISITYDIYNHVLPDHRKDALETVSKLFG